MSGNGWQTVTRKKAARRSSSGKKRSTVKAERRYFPDEFEEAYDELDALATADTSESPSSNAGMAPQRMDAADKARVQTAIVNFFRAGYIKHFGQATDAEILDFIDRYMRRHHICISGGFVLKAIGALAAAAAGSSIDIDIYIPSSSKVRDINETFQKLFGVDRDAAGKPMSKHFRVDPKSRAGKSSFFAKNGIYSVTKYERNTYGIQGGGASSSERRKKQEWEAAVLAGDVAAASALIAAGFNASTQVLVDGVARVSPTVAHIGGANPNAAFLKLLYDNGAPLVQTMVGLIITKPIPEREMAAMIQVVIDADGDIEQSIHGNGTTPLEDALVRNYPLVTQVLLDNEADSTKGSVTLPGKSIYDAAVAGAYPAAATAVLRAHDENVDAPMRILAPNPDRFYDKFVAAKPERDALIDRARAAFTDPICSAEGTFQHSGECWNDSAHMLMLYSDGLADIVQPALLNGDLATLAAHLKGGTSAGNKRAKAMRVYLEAMRSRFARQILNQADTEARCAVDMEAALKAGVGPHRSKGVNTFVSAVMGAPPYKGHGYARPYAVTAADYTYGYYQEHILKELITIFGLGATVKHEEHAYYTTNLPNIIHEPVDSIVGIGLITKAAGLHATCFLTCKGVDYYFDNEKGLFQYPWRKLLKAGASVTTVQLEEGGTIFSRHWPAFFLHDKLIIPTHKGAKRFHVMETNLVGMNDSKTFGTLKITRVAGHGVQSTSVLTWQPGAAPPAVAKVTPAIVGRGEYRARYRPSDTSSETRAIAGQFLKAEMDIVQADNRHTPVKIIRNFDLTFCQNWYDGAELWSMDPEAVHKRAPGTLEPSYVPIFKSGNRVTRGRVLKYIKRGFRVQYRDPDTRAMVEVTRQDLANVNGP